MAEGENTEVGNLGRHVAVAPRPGGRSHLVRGVLGAVLAIAALVTGLSWAFASPVGSSPDDDFHHASIWCRDSGSEFCDFVVSDEGLIEEFTLPAQLTTPCYRFDGFESAACWEDIPEDETYTGSHINRGSYPGGYYAFMAPFVGEDVVSSVLTMRAVNVFLAVGVLTAIAALLPASERRLVLFVAVGSTIPLGWFLIGSVNPSAWAVLGVFGTFLALHGAVVSERWRRAALFAMACLTAVIAFSSRRDAAAYIALVVAAALALHYRAFLARPVIAAIPLGIGVVAAMLFLSSSSTGYLSSGDGQSLILASGQWTEIDADVPTWGEILFYNLVELPSIFFGSFGQGWGLGWLDTGMSSTTRIFASGVFIALLVAGLRAMDRGKLVAMLGVGGALVALPLFILQSRLDTVGVFLQPRYMYPLMVLLLAIALVDLRGKARLTVPQAAMMYLLAVLAHASALHSNIRRYVTGQEINAFDLSDGMEWWWESGPGPMALWLIGSLAFAVFALALFADTLLPPQAPPPPPAAPVMTPPAAIDDDTAPLPLPRRVSLTETEVALPPGPAR